MFDNIALYCLNAEIIKNSFECNSRRTESIDTLELSQDLSRSNVPYTKKEESVSVVVSKFLKNKQKEWKGCTFPLSKSSLLKMIL